MRPNSLLSSEAILDSAPRLPLSPTDQEVILAHLHIARRSGLDLTLNAVLENDMEAMIQGGFLLLQSESLAMDFMLVNVDAGRNLLGWQKTEVFSFHSGLGQEAWLPFQAPDNLKSLLSAINHLYRRTGKAAARSRPSSQPASGGHLAPALLSPFAAMVQPRPQRSPPLQKGAIMQPAPPRKGAGIILPVIGE